MIYLGIDTSCYTTSVAAVDEQDRIVSNQHKLLSVAEGERGLRQSEAFFKHINQFPELYRELLREAGTCNIGAVCVSAKPRNHSSSYMPVFLAGLQLAETISATLGVPLFQTDHQQGHVAAALHGLDILEDKFVSVHLSGGTTDVLLTKLTPTEIKVRNLASSSDINAGQLLDRLGVAMGFPFPAGKYMDEAAMNYTGERVVLPISATMSTCSFSGTEAAALRLLEGGTDQTALAEGLLSAISRTLAKMAGGATYYAGAHTIVMAGGVASSEYLRTALPILLEKRGMSFQLLFAQKELSSDNAVGVARLCRMKAGGTK